VPVVDERDVERVLTRDFSPETIAQARQYLATLPSSLGWRVKLAILKLSRGDLNGVAKGAEMAQRDWRDVIVAAEYPSSGLLTSSARREAREAAWEADWERYQSWLRLGSSV